LGGNDGLYKYDRSADTFIRYKVSGSFAEIPDVSRLVEDNQKYLWFTNLRWTDERKSPAE
jgi:hypothetical protein